MKWKHLSFSLRLLRLGSRWTCLWNRINHSSNTNMYRTLLKLYLMFLFFCKLTAPKIPLPKTSSIVFTTSTSRTWCLKRHGRKSRTWWRGRSSGSAHPSRRCAAAPCLWVRSWTTYRKTWTPCKLNYKPGGGRTKSTHRPCCRSRGEVCTHNTHFIPISCEVLSSYIIYWF